jgi:hypothetical protein
MPSKDCERGMAYPARMHARKGEISDVWNCCLKEKKAIEKYQVCGGRVAPGAVQ